MRNCVDRTRATRARQRLPNQKRRAYERRHFPACVAHPAILLVATLITLAVSADTLTAATVAADSRARFVGDYGMLVDLAASGAAWVEDAVDPTDDYSARFYFKLPSQSCVSCSLIVFEATSSSAGRRLTLGIRSTGGTPGRMVIFLTAQHQLGTSTATLPVELGGWHSAAIRWQASSSGRVELELDGNRTTTLTNLSLGGATIDRVRLGSLDSTPELTGPLFVDEFDSGPFAFELIEDRLLAPPETLLPTGWSGTNPPTFAWSAVPGALSYELRVQNVDRGYEEVFNSEVDGLSLTLDSPLPWTERHVWAVRTRSVAGFGQLSSWTSFRLSCGVSCASEVFSDGFEDGHLGRWTLAQPSSPPAGSATAHSGHVEQP